MSYNLFSKAGPSLNLGWASDCEEIESKTYSIYFGSTSSISKKATFTCYGFANDDGCKGITTITSTCE